MDPQAPPPARDRQDDAQPLPWSKVDLDSTIVLTSTLGILAGVLVIYGKVAELPAEPCGTPGYHCIPGLADASGTVASTVPVVLFLISVALSFRQQRRQQLTWPIPLLGLGLTIATVVGAALVSQLSLTLAH